MNESCRRLQDLTWSHHNETQAFAKELIDAWGSLGGMIINGPPRYKVSSRQGTDFLPSGIGKKESHLAQTIFNNPEPGKRTDLTSPEKSRGRNWHKNANKTWSGCYNHCNSSW